ncbi:chitotriosidase-1 [Biomphalaria pfeifferi]|uniref:Chitotriosidase-1 n=1 Tax=Biomphalaria pfeifferi TaxID=112525 RepID=A0AAD8F864_BIOPF|nr:chitotriosidase-1 [Biomphalaria pfeifferi]
MPLKLKISSSPILATSGMDSKKRKVYTTHTILAHTRIASKEASLLFKMKITVFVFALLSWIQLSHGLHLILSSILASYSGKLFWQVILNFITSYVLSKGCAQEKLLIAISPESLTFEKSVGYLLKTKNFTLKGLFPYSYFCQSLKEYSPKVQRSNDLAPYVYYDVRNKYSKSVEKSVIHYFEDAVNVKSKVNYIKQKGLGGFVLWEFIHDDFLGNCFEDQYPILSILKRECK